VQRENGKLSCHVFRKKPRHPNSKSKQNKCYFTNVSKLFYNDKINIKSYIGFFFSKRKCTPLYIDLIAYCMLTAYYNTLYTLVRVPVQHHHMCIIYVCILCSAKSKKHVLSLLKGKPDERCQISIGKSDTRVAGIL